MVAVLAVSVFVVPFVDGGEADSNGKQVANAIVEGNESADGSKEVKGSFGAAIAMLHASNMTSGIEMLEQLSDKGDADATFLLSRLYFNSLKDDDYCPDSILAFKRNSNIEVDFNRSHQLLKKAIAQNPKCYQALYELGCDYLGGKSRTQAVSRDIKMADKYLTEAYLCAKAVEDKQYISLIEAQMKKYK